MHALRTTILSVVTLSLLLPVQSFGRAVTITYTGTVSYGFDKSGIFGTLNGDLKGRPFTAVFTFDDSTGVVKPPACSGQTCQSSVAGRYPTSPGTATLKIGDRSYSFGIPLATDPQSGATTNSGASRMVQDFPAINYHLFVANATVVDFTKSIIVSAVGPADKPLPTTDPDWRAPLCFSNASNTTSSGEFSISTPQGETKGELLVYTMSVGNACAPAEKPCQNATGADATPSISPQISDAATPSDDRCQPNRMRIQLQRKSDGKTLPGQNSIVKYDSRITKLDLNQILITIPERAKAWQPFPNRLLPQLEIAIKKVHDKIERSSMICGADTNFIQEIIPDKLDEWRIDVDNLFGCNLFQ